MNRRSYESTVTGDVLILTEGLLSVHHTGRLRQSQLDNFCKLQPIIRHFAKAISGNSDSSGHTPPRWMSVFVAFVFYLLPHWPRALYQSVISHITGSSLQSPSSPLPIGPKMCGGSREDIT